MPKGELKINGKDAYVEWGISFEQTGLSALLTPPGMKAAIESNYRRLHGKKVVNIYPRFSAREVIIPFHLIALDTNDFFDKYERFCNEVLASGMMNIETKYQPGVVYKFNYLSCSQFSEFITEYAAFSLKLEEPDPADR